MIEGRHLISTYTHGERQRHFQIWEGRVGLGLCVSPAPTQSGDQTVAFWMDLEEKNIIIGRVEVVLAKDRTGTVWTQAA